MKHTKDTPLTGVRLIDAVDRPPDMRHALAGSDDFRAINRLRAEGSTLDAELETLRREHRTATLLGSPGNMRFAEEAIRPREHRLTEINAELAEIEQRIPSYENWFAGTCVRRVGAPGDASFYGDTPEEYSARVRAEDKRLAGIEAAREAKMREGLPAGFHRDHITGIIRDASGRAAMRCPTCSTIHHHGSQCYNCAHVYAASGDWVDSETVQRRRDFEIIDAITSSDFDPYADPI